MHNSAVTDSEHLGWGLPLGRMQSSGVLIAAIEGKATYMPKSLINCVKVEAEVLAAR